MSRTVSKTVFKYEELDKKAKEKARDWFREGGFDYDWWDSTYEDVVTIAALFGLTISTRVQKYHVMGRDGKPGRDGQTTETNIMFSGFWSQGDGACFEGSYEYKADAIDAVKEYAPRDTTLLSIVSDLQAEQLALGNRVAFNITHTGHYCHERSMTMELVEEYYDAEGEALPDDKVISWQQAKPVEECLIRFANWIYRRLEEEYEYLNSDETVADNIEANEYEFEIDGTRTRD